MARSHYVLELYNNGNILPGRPQVVLDLDTDGVGKLDFLGGNPSVGQLNTILHTALAGGFTKVTVQDGEDETTTHQITCAGMAVGDEVVAVLVLTTKASIATMAAHAGTLTAAAGKITPGTEVDNSSKQYLIFWNDLT